MPCTEIPLDCGPPRGMNIGLLQVMWNVLLTLLGLGPSGSSGVVVTSSSGVRTTTAALATDSSNSPIPAGSRSVIFGISSDFEGTINGVAIDASDFASIPYVAPGNDTLAAIAYTVTAGSLLITKVV